VRRGSKTSSFGVTKREAHDASAFYAQRLYEQAPETEKKTATTSAVSDNPPTEVVWEDGDAPYNRIYCGDSQSMSELPDDSIHLMVTSPPYNVGKDYDDNLNLEEYLALLRQVFTETYRVLVPGGRACINIANLGRRPYVPLHSYIITDMIEIGYLMRGEIIWDKGASAGVSCAWGSFASASNPVLRDVHEYILVFSKGDFKRDKGDKENTIAKDDFVSWTKSIWQMGTESARKVGHPAPFPIELPRRLIELYTFVDDVVLDPFCGSGTTCVAAAQNRRRYVGYDISPEYARLAATRLRMAHSEARQGALPLG
jgi:DNA modification methylase